MSTPAPSVAVRVRILDREYPLRVAPGDEDYTVHLAARVDERIRRLRQQIPTQPDMTHVVLAALELAEELYAARADTDRLRARVELESSYLTDQIDAVLGASGDGAGGRPPRDPGDGA